jgi:hypothetical protein
MHSLITNPPYNLKWKPPALAGFMPKYSGYTIPPEQNANYAFILSGLELSDSRSVFLLPNGVLASSVKAEQEIRQQLIQQNLLLAVIALPPNMFESTSIPTCILVFDKHKETRMTAMIDLTEHCTEETRDQRGQFGGNSHTGRTYHKTVNVIPPEIMGECIDLIESKKDELLSNCKGRWVTMFGVNQDTLSVKISTKKPKIINERRIVWDTDDKFEYYGFELGTTVIVDYGKASDQVVCLD